ncbi:MAG: hypothetical protein DCF15_15900, partial [Phormidesmis priestleyi]
MTAPQPTPQPSANHNSKPHQQKGGGLQRGWLVTLGLLGSFGFVTGQVDLAIAETNLLIGDYTPSTAADSATADTATAPTANQAPYSQTAELPVFEVTPVVAAAPQPEAFVDVSANLSEAIESLAPAPVQTPSVTAVAPPAFTANRPQQPVQGKLVKPRRVSPLAGLLGASAIAAPISDYARGPVALALESPDSAAVEAAPTPSAPA